MAYTPTTWVTGDTVTATKMNKIENGIANAGSALIVDWSGNSGLNKTVQEIYDALLAGTPTYVRYTYGDVLAPSSQSYAAWRYLMPITTVYRYADNQYRIMIVRAGGDYTSSAVETIMFQATSMSAYPTYHSSH